MNRFIIVIIAPLILILAFGNELIGLNFLTKKTSLEVCMCTSEMDSILLETVYLKVDTMPVFIGGKYALLNYFHSNLILLEKDEDFQSSFIFEFVVDIDGSIIGERIKNKNYKQCSNSENTALIVLKKMPKWRPGKCNGEIVPVKLILPLKL